MPGTDIAPSDQLLAELRGWVERETPSTDPAAVNGLLAMAEGALRSAGAAVERHPPDRSGFGDTLIARTPGQGAPVVVAGHLDTVWDHGTLAGPMPWRVDGERAYGPGIYDMKAGSFMAFYCVREILRQRTRTARPITLLLTPDEEVGSPTSRAHIEREAAGAAAVLIPEPAGGLTGACVTSRKGTGMFAVRVIGRSAHAGGNWSEGRSAVVALARIVLAIHAMTDLDLGVTTNCAPVWGGTRSNVIPPEAGCRVDFRVPNLAEGERVVAAIRALAGVPEDGIAVEITGGLNRPPFPETPATLALYERARVIAAAQGYRLPKQSRGGGSDGNFTAVMGVPTLDGLGCTGGGAHAPDEHIRWPDLAPRCAVLCELMETL
jgi:glutamate carboxypeptidase